jgi:hypothetical protein
MCTKPDCWKVQNAHDSGLNAFEAAELAKNICKECKERKGENK